MNVNLPIPDDLTARLGGADEVSRRALEAFAAEEYCAGRLTRPELRRLLGLGTHADLKDFLKARGIAEATTEDEREQRGLDLATGDVVGRFRAFRADKNLGGLDPTALIREGRR